MFPEDRRHVQRLILWAAPLLGLACGGEGGIDVVLPSLTVSTTTSGVEIDADGYGVSIDSRAVQPIGVNATLTADGLADGQHSVELSGLATNCSVQGENPQSVSVVAGATATAAFAITCAPGTGSLQVTTVTAGTGTDPDGYSLVLDGAEAGAIGVSGTATLPGIPVGFHTIGLTGLGANCQISGENPREVAVPAGAAAQVDFAITCAAPGPTTGTIGVVTTTGGGGTDPDGFSLLLDGIDRGPVAVNASNSLAGTAAGSHTIGLTGLAANCQLAGQNPRPISVPAGGAVQVTFAVTCTFPGPTTGTLRITTVTTGSPPDPDGYRFSVDGGAAAPIGTSATVSLANISAGQHTVELQNLAANCRVSGSNPLGAALGAGETATISFAVTCAATAGALTVTVSGLPASVAAAVTVTGPDNFSETATQTRTLSGLVPGSYAVTASPVVSGNTTYTPSVGRPNVNVVAGATASVTVSYTGQGNITLNLRIDGLYLTQSTQTYASAVPLVAGRNGYLRVFVVANESNSASPSVRVELAAQGVPARTFTLTASSSVPERVNEGTLGSSWNLEVPGALIQPGLTVTAVVDPENSIRESNENDNRFPASSAKALTVQSVATARIRFISVQQGTAAPGDISNPDRLIDMARRMYPLRDVSIDVDPAVYQSGELSTDPNSWFQLLSDLDGKRVTEGTDRIYFGIAKLGYPRSSGLVGLTLGQGVPTAVGWDDAADASRVVAHELGHVWGRKHSPCGNPPDVGQYPHAGGLIGVFGMDVARGELKPRSSPDIMSYCFDNPWISDFTYGEVLKFRSSHSFVSASTAIPQSSVLVWGRLVNGRPVLEPAFQIVARSSLPRRPGPYSVTGTALDGTQLFRISFDVAVSEDGPPGNGHFAFTVPLDQARALTLQSLQLAGPAGSAMASKPLALLRAAPRNQVVARREGANVSLRWDAAAYPMIMVRNPDTGEVLSFARGGRALVQTSKEVLDLDISDGVRSQRVRLAISRS